MPVGDKRNRTLYGLGAKRASLHRYTLIRWGVGIVLTVAIALLPITNTLRLDLWSGRHHWLGEQVGLVEALKAFAFPFLAVNVVIILVSRLLGRWLCGFVCPVGNLNRLAEWVRWHDKKARVKRSAVALGIPAVCLLLAAITFSFWVDWRVFLAGSVFARVVAGAFLFGMAGGLYAIVQRLGMRFCRDYCPSGVYFAVLGPTSATGVQFAHPETCTDCHACENVCPVDLKPRELLTGEERAGTGFYPDGMTNLANCLRCGDCISVCEATSAGDGAPLPLRLGFLEREPEAAAGRTE